MTDLQDAIRIIPASDLEAQKSWIAEEFSAIGEDVIQTLIATAVVARKKAYAPYSKYLVGAAVLTQSGDVYAGCNSEVVSWSESTHGEQNAMTTAVAAGAVEKSGRKFLRAIAVAHDSDSAPCGHCRQILGEHADNAIVLWTDGNGVIRTITSLKTLLPFAFTPTDLGIT